MKNIHSWYDLVHIYTRFISFEGWSTGGFVHPRLSTVNSALSGPTFSPRGTLAKSVVLLVDFYGLPRLKEKGTRTAPVCHSVDVRGFWNCFGEMSTILPKDHLLSLLW